MAFRDEDKDDFTKPSRQNRGSKKTKTRSNEVRVPKEPYRRQRFTINDVLGDHDFDEEDDY